MTEVELAHALTDLPGVVMTTATEENGDPEVAWGDSFFFYDPDDNIPADRRQPFATIVVSNYPGFDEASQLDRPGVFRLNLAVGRARFEDLFGFPPADFPDHEKVFDFAVLDQIIPHPVYAKQGWISILVPGEKTKHQLPALIAYAHQRAADRHRPPRPA